jgi:lysozyme
MSDLVSQLKRDEGTSLKLYRDTRGFWTIGTGRNLDADGITSDENDLMLSNDVKRATVRLNAAFPFAASLDEVRRGVLLNMTFNMGIGGLLECARATIGNPDSNG